MAAITKFDIISKAMTLIDAEEVESLESSNPSREEEVAGQLYELAKYDELTQRDWNFNRATYVLSLTNETPVDPNWQYSFLLPADTLKILNILDQSGNNVLYNVEGNRVYTNTQIVIAKYLKDIPESEMPWHFVALLVARLSIDFSESLNGSDTVIKRRKNDYNAKFKSSARIDSQVNPPTEFYRENPGSWAVTPTGLGGYTITGA